MQQYNLMDTYDQLYIEFNPVTGTDELKRVTPFNPETGEASVVMWVLPSRKDIVSASNGELYYMRRKVDMILGFCVNCVKRRN